MGGVAVLVVVIGGGCWIRQCVVSVWIDGAIHRVIERECSMIVLKMVDLRWMM